MYAYTFEVSTSSTNKAIQNSLQQLTSSFSVQLTEDHEFVAERLNNQKKTYFVPTSTFGTIQQQEATTTVISCRTTLSASAMFRQLLISIILLSVIMMTWRQSGNGIMALQLLCGVSIVGSFLNGWKNIRTDAELFKKQLEKQL